MKPDKAKQACNKPQFAPLTILGAGSFGTALALYLARQGQIVHIWSVVPDEIKAMQQDRVNERYLPGFSLPNQIKPYLDLDEALHHVEDILLAIPSVGYRSTLERLINRPLSEMNLLSVTKGIDAQSGQFMDEVARTVLGESIRFSILSGPSFAKEVAAGLPTGVVIASKDSNLREAWQKRFESALLHIQLSDDVTGVEVCAVVKNVIAIATGITDGMNLGANARSALITCGLDEMTRLGLALGGKKQTFTSLAGMGDLILTCSDDQSRNRRLGLAIGQGKNIQKAEQAIGQAVEGKQNAQLVVKLAKKYHCDMPICELLNKILQNQLRAEEAVQQFLSQSSK